MFVCGHTIAFLLGILYFLGTSRKRDVYIKKLLLSPPSFYPPFIIILKYYFKVGSQPEGMGSGWSPLTKLKRQPLLVSKCIMR